MGGSDTGAGALPPPGWLSERDPERVVDGIREHIRLRGLGPGDPLPSEQALGAMFGASRAVVRTALGVLAALRMVDIGNGRRARVAPADCFALAMLVEHAVHAEQIAIKEVCDARRLVEVRAAGLAAARRTAQDGAALVDLSVAMGVALPVPARIMACDLAFHESLARASGNRMLALLVRSFQSVNHQLWPIAWASRREEAQQRAMVAAHAAVAEAVADRDPAAAQAAMDAHFDLLDAALLASGAV